MRFLDLDLALRALARNALRSLLTVVSVAIGCFGIVTMTSLAESGFASLSRSIEQIGGARLLMFVPKNPERAETLASSYATGFTEVDRERAFSAVPGVKVASMIATFDRKDVVADTGRTSPTDLVAADSGFFELYGMRVAQGRAF